MHRLSQLLDLDAAAEDTRFPIRALFHDERTRRLRMAAVDIGGWLDRREVLVSLDRFGEPGDGIWPVSMTREELDDAPEWHHHEGSASFLPPLLVGPFGHTFSPMLMAAGLAVSAERSLPAHAQDESTELYDPSDERLKGLERSGDWFGREAFGPEGRMGAVADLAIRNMTITGLILDEDDRIVPLSRLRHIAGQGHFVFD